MSASEDAITVTLAGDAIVNRRLRSINDDRFTELVRAVREADVGFVNLEVLLHEFEGYPTGTTTGTYMQAPPWVADELTWAGFNLFSAAVNHSFDYSHGGMEATMRELDARELAYAGLGRNLAAARAPAYHDTEAGRVGLVAACATLPTPAMIAGEQRRDLQGRPGVSPLRTAPRYVVSEEQIDALRSVSEQLGLEAIKREKADSSYAYLYAAEDDSEGFEFLTVGYSDNLTFEAGDDPGIYREPNEEDVRAIVQQVRYADRQADWVVASLHAHEGANGRDNDDSTPAFMEAVARACIDAGADVFVGHGPHRLRGIEMYEGKPIFYSVGNFIGQNQLIARLPTEAYDRYGLDRDAHPVDVFDHRVYDDAGNPSGFLADETWWESVLPVCRFEEGSLEEVRLLPVDLQRELPRPRRGRPVRAAGAVANRILDRLADLSAPYGTEVDIDAGIGRLRLA